MKGRIIALVLAVALLLALPVPSRAANSAEADPVTVLVNIFSNRMGTEKLKGLYRDNTFYLDAWQIATLSGAEVTEAAADKVTFSLHGGLRLFTVSGDEKVTEIQGKEKRIQPMAALTRDGRLYISAVDILRYMGATVGFGADEKAEVHMMVTMPYTVLDLLWEFHENRGFAFSWAEAEGKWVDPEDVLELAALDTVLLGYDSNLLAYALPGYADHVETTIHQDVLLELLRVEGETLVTYEDPAVEILNYLGDYTEVSFTWIQETMDWAAETDVQKKLAGVWGDYLDEVGLVVDMTSGCISSLETAKQFANLTATQKNLMASTLCRVHSSTELYKMHPMMFDAARQAHALMTGEYSAKEKAAWDSVYNAMGNMVDMLTPPNPVSTAWDVLTGIAKLDPLVGSLLEAEKKITFASECGDVRILVNALLDTDLEKMDANNGYLGKNDTNLQGLMKYDVILSLKASLCARLLLLETNWLTEDAQAAMERKAQDTALLLNKAQNARQIPLGVYEKNEADISWIEKLACAGGFGNVVSVGGYTYYWRYTNDSFSTEGFGSFGHTGVFNSFVRRGADEKTQELFYLNGNGEFAVAGGYVFYQTLENEIRSINLDGTEKKVWGDGFLCGCTEDGQYVFFEAYQGAYGETSIYRIDVAKGTCEKLVSASGYVTYYDGRIYYTKYVDMDLASSGQLALWSVRPDGTDNIHLYTTAPDLYEYADMYSDAMVDHIRFTDNYIYFSYGSLGGSGAIFQGAKIVRVGYDGTGGRVVAGNDSLVNGHFSVTENDVLTTYEPSYPALYNYGTSFRTEHGNIYVYEPRTGVPQLVVSYGDYDAVGSAQVEVYGDDGIVLVDFAEVVNGKVYYLVYSAKEENTVWWMSYVRKKTAMLVKDLETGTVKVLFQF